LFLIHEKSVGIGFDSFKAFYEPKPGFFLQNYLKNCSLFSLKNVFKQHRWKANKAKSLIPTSGMEFKH